MTKYEILQLCMFILGLLAVTKPVGLYLHKVLNADGKTFLDSCIGPVERFLYRVFGIDPCREQGWRQYSVSLVCFSLIGTLFTYAVLRLQHVLPLHADAQRPLHPDGPSPPLPERRLHSRQRVAALHTAD